MAKIKRTDIAIPELQTLLLRTCWSDDTERKKQAQAIFEYLTTAPPVEAPAEPKKISGKR